jgi:hypothetical protein
MQKTSPIALEISTAARVVRVIFFSSDGKLEWLERDDFYSSHHPASAFCLCVIFSENRCPLFGITH